MSTALTGSSIVGIVLLVAGALCMWKKVSLKLVTWMWVGAGFTLAGSVVTGLQGLIREAAKTAGGPVGLGANVVVGLTGVALMWVVFREAPLRKGRGRGGPSAGGPTAGGSSSAGTKKYTPFLGLLAPMLMLTSTGVLGSWAASIGNALGKLGGPLATFFGA
jgi:hypothetical protein